MFEVEKHGQTLANFAPYYKHDRLRALGAKVTNALLKIAKGEPARRIAFGANKVALAKNLLSRRQPLHTIYAEFRRDETRTDAATYTYVPGEPQVRLRATLR